MLLELIDYLCDMNQQTDTVSNLRTIIRTPEFDEFFMNLSDRVKDKFLYVFQVIQSVYNISTKFVKHLEKTDLYEMRVSVGSNEYRTILFAVDHDNIIESTRIILLKKKKKKSSKDYKKQIEIARTILNRLRK